MNSWSIKETLNWTFSPQQAASHNIYYETYQMCSYLIVILLYIACFIAWLKSDAYCYFFQFFNAAKMKKSSKIQDKCCLVIFHAHYLQQRMSVFDMQSIEVVVDGGSAERIIQYNIFNTYFNYLIQYIHKTCPIICAKTGQVLAHFILGFIKERYLGKSRIKTATFSSREIID